MADPVQTPTPKDRQLAERQYRQLQESALQDLLTLAAEAVADACLPIEREIEQAKAVIDKRFARVNERLEQRYQSRRQTLETHHNQQTEQVKKLHASDLQALKDKNTALRQRINADCEAAIREAKRKLDQEVWLTESVAEATRNQIALDQEAFRKDLPARRATLSSLEEQADWVLTLYGQELGALPAAQESAPTRAGDALSSFQRHCDAAGEEIDRLAGLTLPRLFRGASGYVLAILVVVATAGGAAGLSLLELPHYPALPVAAGVGGAAGLIFSLLAGWALRPVARAQVLKSKAPLVSALGEARTVLDHYAALTEKSLDQRRAEATEKRERAIQSARNVFQEAADKAQQHKAARLEEADRAYGWLHDEIKKRRDTSFERVEQERLERGPRLEESYRRRSERVKQWHETQSQILIKARDEARGELEREWRAGIDRILRMLETAGRLNEQVYLEWGDPHWERWQPPHDARSLIRFGQLRLDLDTLADPVRERCGLHAEFTGPVSVPAVLSFPDRGSLLLETGRRGREDAIHVLQAVMARLLTLLPPGRVQFTIIDPVGLGENFAGFMHLADYREALVGGRIWTDSGHIEQRLVDLTTHMEDVIQKYLRNEFDTIDAYNRQAGELAEPYRFLVIAGFPVNFTEEACRRLSSIVASGARCGVYTLVACDTRQELPGGFQLEDLESNSITIAHKSGRFVWRDPLFGQFPLTLDAPPPEEMLTRLMHAIGARARASSRVEVPFETIAPAERQRWSLGTDEGISVPVGRTGATRLQELRLGQGMAQHALIAGKTGSGKSTLLHVIITNLVQWYPPDEVEFYLIDFKKGVEFKTYAEHELPHARAVAIESDREFGLSVLHRLDEEMTRRGDRFRKAGVQDIAAYRKATGDKLPRTLLIVDEFQIFFSEDDKLSQDAAILLDRLVRQGRAFGIHVVLGSQTLGGGSGLARSTIGQMAVRIALQCSEADSQLILDDDNTAARLLSRPGEAIYNDAGGLVQGNCPFQTAWLSDAQRDAHLRDVMAMARDRAERTEPLIVFEGNAAADATRNRPLTDLAMTARWPEAPAAPRIWLGEAVAIKEPTSVALRRQNGANVMLVGQRDDAALAIMTTAMLSLAAQHRPDAARFEIFDGSPADAPNPGWLERVAGRLPHPSRSVTWRDVESAIDALWQELQQRQGGSDPHPPSIFVVIYGLQRYRMLRRREDDYGFSSMDEDKPPGPERQIADLLKEGPPLGIHVLAWVDAAVTLERTFDRQTLREFDNRVLFQMSANDSSNLIDSPAANQLGFYRALFHSEELGVLEKFRPYALPPEAWIDDMASHLRAKR